jgi:hypothetical protein
MNVLKSEQEMDDLKRASSKALARKVQAGALIRGNANIFHMMFKYELGRVSTDFFATCPSC